MRQSNMRLTTDTCRQTPPPPPPTGQGLCLFIAADIKQHRLGPAAVGGWALGAVTCDLRFMLIWSIKTDLMSVATVAFQPEVSRVDYLDSMWHSSVLSDQCEQTKSVLFFHIISDVEATLKQ